MTVNSFSDRSIFFWLCVLVFFLPCSNAIVEIASAFMIFFFLLKKSFAGRSAWLFALPEGKILLPMLLFFFWSFLSIFWSHSPLLSLKAFIGKSLQAGFLFVIVHEALRSVRKVRVFAGFLLFGALIVCLDGLWQSYSGYDFLTFAAEKEGRVMASFKHPNDFGAYLVFIILPVFMLAFMTGRQFFKARYSRDFFEMLSWSLFALLMALVLGLTYSRGAWLGSVVAVLLFLLLVPRFGALLFGCVILFGVIFTPLLSQSRNVLFISDNIMDSSSFGGSGRLNFWNDAIRIIRDHPVFGTGLNTYTMVIKDYALHWKAYPHNCYLQMGAEIGLVGLALFLWFLGAVTFVVLRQIMRMPQKPARWMLAAFWAGWFGVLVHSGLDTTFYSSQLSALFWVMTGVLVSVAEGRHIRLSEVLYQETGRINDKE